MEALDRFYALSAPIRREIISLLSSGDQLTATKISEKFQVSPSAISQHLKILLNSDLLNMHKHAQQRIYQINSDAIKELESWASQIVNSLEDIGGLIEGAGDQPLTDGANK